MTKQDDRRTERMAIRAAFQYQYSVCICSVADYTAAQPVVAEVTAIDYDGGKAVLLRVPFGQRKAANSIYNIKPTGWTEVADGPDLTADSHELVALLLAA